MFICEVFCNDIQVMKPTAFSSLRKVAEKLELTSNQIYDIFEGRTIKKYSSKIMPKISITKQSSLVLN